MRPGYGLKGAVLSLALFSTIVNGLMLVMPIYMTQVYDRILPTRSVETLGYLTLIAGGALALFGLVETLRQTIARKASARYELGVMPRLIEAADEGAAALDPQLVAKPGTVKRFLASSAFVHLFDLPFAPFFLALMFLAHPLLGWLTAAGMGLLVVVALLNDWFSRKASAMAAASQAKAMRNAQDALAVQEDLRAMGMGGAMAERWMGSALESALAGERAGRVNARFFGLTRFVRQALQVAVLGLGAWLVIHGDMSAGLIFAASIVSARALMPIEQVVGSWKAIVEARRAKADIDAVLARAAGAAGSRERLELPATEGRLSASRLAWAAGQGPDAPRIVNDVTLDVRPGEIVAIVGASGSGKSTLLRLLGGALDPTSGDVRLDGFRLAEWPAATRGRALGYMAQQIMLFEGTVAENIARFDPAATDASIVEAARRAEAHDFIATLPQGYNTRVGPGGVRLSGGQVQRIALARALFTRPAVLLLDEPNAHLDSVGEDALVKTLISERDERHAVVVVSHRNSVVNIADRVLLMEGGRLRPIAPGAQAAPPRQGSVIAALDQQMSRTARG